jgi:hypothetical protein
MKMEGRKTAIDKIYKRRNRYEIPEYQREEVWGIKEKQLLIDTVLRGWKLPKFYFLKSGPSSYEVVDGQQRLTAIFEFLDGELELSAESSELYGGAETYDDLDEDVPDGFDDFEIDFDEIDEATEGEIEEFFKRLQGGFRLNSPERLNAVPSKLTTFCRGLARHPFFKKSVSFKDKRYAYFDVAAKAAAIEIDGFDAGMRINELEPLFKSQAAFSASSKVGRRLKAALDFLGESLLDSSKALRLRSVTQSIITLACKLSENNIAAGNEVRFRNFVENFVDELAEQVELGHAATDADYLAFQKTVNANVKGGARIRHQILLRKLFQFDPSFVEGFGSTVLAVSGTDHAIKATQAQIASLISTINTIYSAQHGKDLFKATNKTATSLIEIGRICRDADDYERLVENLYFLVWEGPKGRLEQIPESFKLVNTLRTEIQHDVDHGGAKDLKKKKLAAASAFQSLAGISSPAAAPPERFPFVQLGLLTAIRGDLVTLRKVVEEL